MKSALGSRKPQVVGNKILARSLYRELRANGCDSDQVLGICSEIIEQVTRDLEAQPSATEDAQSAA